MTRTAIAYLRTELERRIAAEGLRPLAKAIDVPLEQIRSIVSGRSPRSSTIEQITEALGFEFYIGPPRHSAVIWRTLHRRTGRFSVQAKPRITVLNAAMAGAGVKDVPRPDTLPLPQAVGDKDAFWVTATGASMAPEGIESGWLCLVSPAVQPVPGDRIWIRDTSGAAAIKRLASIKDDGALHLRNWRNKPAGQPQSFEEKLFPADIERVHPVVAVFKGKPGSKHFEYVPDPGAPASPQVAAPPELIAVLGLPEGASMAEAVSAIEERLKDAGGDSDVAAAITIQMEALRSELRSEIADAKFAVYEGLADASALAGDETDPPEARPVAVVELASVAGNGATFLSEDVLGRVWFRRAWLDENDLDAEHCAVIGVNGRCHGTDACGRCEDPDRPKANGPADGRCLCDPGPGWPGGQARRRGCQRQRADAERQSIIGDCRLARRGADHRPGGVDGPDAGRELGAYPRFAKSDGGVNATVNRVPLFSAPLAISD